MNFSVYLNWHVFVMLHCLLGRVYPGSAGPGLRQECEGVPIFMVNAIAIQTVHHGNIFFFKF